MGNRLSRIYTRTGDDGTTGLGDGSRTGKDSARVESMGAVDELNAVIGIMLTETLPEPIRQALTQVQHDLFDIGGEICIPGYEKLTADKVDFLETFLDTLNEDLPPLKEFILPGGSGAAAYCHLARTVCRRAERELVHMHREEPVSKIAMCYINRLSDLLFVMARAINKAHAHPDVLWNNQYKF